jgi:hypothetical protein
VGISNHSLLMYIFFFNFAHHNSNH